MDFSQQLTLSASMLLTGFAVVFAVLFLLIFIIWGYGKIISGAQNKSAARKKAKLEAKQAAKKTQKTDSAESVVAEKAPTAQVASEGLSDEVVAVISAAVYSMYGSKEKVRIMSIKRRGSRSAWANAGVADNTRPF